MNRLIATLFFIVFVDSGYGQVDSIIIDTPVFNGGLQKYINDNLIYPDHALKNNISGRVFVSFVVNINSGTKAKITDVKVEKGIHPILDSAAVELVRSIPDKWKRKSRGKYEPVKLFIPIMFNLEKYKSEHPSKLSNYSQIVIKGRALDYIYREPLYDVNIETDDDRVLSDLNGRFYLNSGTKAKIRFSRPGYIDLIFLVSNDIDTLVCDFYMIPIEPYKPCIVFGACSNYSRKMDRLWIKKRRIESHTPLNWRLECLKNYAFIEDQGHFKFKYELVFSQSFYDYRKYGKMAEQDYIICKIEK